MGSMRARLTLKKMRFFSRHGLVQLTVELALSSLTSSQTDKIHSVVFFFSTTKLVDIPTAAAACVHILQLNQETQVGVTPGKNEFSSSPV